jgi:ribosome-dependent ATPase
MPKRTVRPSFAARARTSAIFFATIGTIIPAVQFAGLINPVSSLEGGGRLIGEIYPASYMLIISRGVFSKALGFSDLHAQFWPLLIAPPIIMGAAIALLNKQER